MFIYFTVSAQVCSCVCGERDPKRDEYKLLVQNNNNSRNTNV